jgi:hypothetical protein
VLKDDQVAELKGVSANPVPISEGGYEFVFLPGVTLPSGCTPSVVDLLLCPQSKDNYQTRLYFSQQVTGPGALNWNSSVRIAERNWVAFSWQGVAAEQRLLQILLGHLDAFKKKG